MLDFLSSIQESLLFRLLLLVIGWLLALQLLLQLVLIPGLGLREVLLLLLVDELLVVQLGLHASLQISSELMSQLREYTLTIALEFWVTNLNI